ncbi:DNA-binding MarR family transcriptional regulator [Bradyrhizobium sp. AZCC 1610]
MGPRRVRRNTTTESIHVSNRAAKSRAETPVPRGRRRTVNGGSRPDAGDLDIGLDALAGHAGYAVRRFQIWIFQDFIRTLAAVDIRPTQYSVMTVIGANPGLSQMAVAKRLGIERARLVHLLDSLEQRELVSRLRSATDRRSHALHLTARGRTALAQFRRLAAEHERHVADKIGKENRERLLQILSAFT